MDICALTPDNDLQIYRLTELFEETFGETYPARRVYDLQFWKNHIGSRFISIAGFEKGKMVAHIAIQPDRQNPRHLQISFPVYNPEKPEQAKEFAQKVIPLLSKMAQRQNWEMLYFFMFAGLPGMQEVCSDLFGLKEMALLPAYMKSEALQYSEDSSLINQAQPVLVSQIVFNPETYEHRTLFVPNQHIDFCRFLYNENGLKRTLKAGNIDSDQLREGVNADFRAIDKRVFKNINVTLSFIHPSLVSSEDRVKYGLQSHTDMRNYLFIDMHDPKCPEFCDDLEKLGYSFAGVLPLLHNCDYIIYMAENASHMKLRAYHTDRAQRLEDYVFTGFTETCESIEEVQISLEAEK